MRYWLLEAFSLSDKHVAPFELGTLHETILVSVNMAVCFTADVAEEFAEMKGRIDVKEVS